ncbi:UNVERIFIED_ORG: hypothetical protein B2H93_04670 [Clostridium botulinum]
MSELERIAKVLKIKEKDNLCLKIQDKIKEKDKYINKLSFMNYVYKEKLKVQPIKIIKEHGDTEKEVIRLKKLVLDLNTAINGLKEENKKYQQEKIRNMFKLDNTYISKEMI